MWGAHVALRDLAVEIFVRISRGKQNKLFSVLKKKLNITKLRECKVFQIIKHLSINAVVQVAYTLCVDLLKRIVGNVQKEDR